MSDSVEAQTRRLALDSFYAPLEQASSPARRVGWEDDNIQKWRHQLLLDQVEPLHVSKSVLDVGCGEGALLLPLRERGFSGHYRGEDLREAPIQIAKRERIEAHSPPCDFVCIDSLSNELPSADLVICSGTFNTVQPGLDQDSFLASAIEHLFARTQVALVLDMAVKGRHQGGVGIALSDPEALLKKARALTPHVSLSESGVPGEAVLMMARTRELALHRLNATTAVKATLALDYGELRLAHTLIQGLEKTASRQLLEARLFLAQGERQAAETLLLLLSAHAKHGLEASLLLAPLYYRKGQKDESEAILAKLAPHHDEAAAHLCELRRARGNRAGALEALALIKDAWMQRELASRLGPT